MRTKDLKWSKTRAECPYCGEWFTRQGILGHIRFRHPDKEEREDDTTKQGNRLVYMRAAGVFAKHGRLTPELRESSFDQMLLDFLYKKAGGKS